MLCEEHSHKQKGLTKLENFGPLTTLQRYANQLFVSLDKFKGLEDADKLKEKVEQHLHSLEVFFKDQETASEDIIPIKVYSHIHGDRSH